VRNKAQQGAVFLCV